MSDYNIPNEYELIRERLLNDKKFMDEIKKNITEELIRNYLETRGT